MGTGVIVIVVEGMVYFHCIYHSCIIFYWIRVVCEAYRCVSMRIDELSLVSADSRFVAVPGFQV